MSYRCGIYEPLATLMRVEPGPPTITCDGCGLRRSLSDRRVPPQWFMDGKAAPGWRMEKHEDGTRTDLCARCKLKDPVTDILEGRGVGER